MTWNYANTPTIWPSCLTVLFLIGMAVFSWRKRSVPGALPFLFGCLFSGLWAAGSVMEYAAVDAATKIFWVKFQAAWQIPAATAITCFILEYAWPGRWLTHLNLALLSISPLLLVVLILTNDLHHLVWRSFMFDGSITPVVGAATWILIAYSYGLGILNFIVLAWLFLRSPQHRLAAVMMVCGQILIRTVYLLERATILRSELPLDVLGLMFMNLVYAIALFGFRIFDPLPQTFRTVIAQMLEGMLVLDAQGRVMSLNPAAERILRMPAKYARGKPARKLLPGYPDGQLGDIEKTEIELSLAAGGEIRHYNLAISRLNDWRGLDIGRLLLLHDVTGQRRSQARILEQQRALATLHERDRLARELHDELAQDLALINLQAQLVGGLLEAGQEEQAREQLQVLARAAREAQVDVRGEIGKLSHRMDPVEGFLGSLRHFTEAFQQTCGIEIALFLPGNLLPISFTPTAEVQLLRIVQEAFANIRKHARAKHVRVSLTKEPGCMLLRIEDDGVGFDPDKHSTSHQAFGLGIMSQRAEEVGGRVEVKSASGKGTQVIIQVPVNEETL